jgi:hypothetical protein
LFVWFFRSNVFCSVFCRGLLVAAAKGCQEDDNHLLISLCLSPVPVLCCIVLDNLFLQLLQIIHSSDQSFVVDSVMVYRIGLREADVHMQKKKTTKSLKCTECRHT